jgi:hypothetical protein
MKTLVLTLLLVIPGLALADGGQWINHNGFLYWIEADGTWYYKGPTPKHWKDPQKVAAEKAEKQQRLQQAAREKQQRDFWAWYNTLYPETQLYVLKCLEQNERDQAQADRDQVQQDIEMDLSNIMMTLDRIEMDSN